ncbi:hypothetical protein O9H85_24270 [Paenibacillus filicis]|uniref:Uncharacterized protein n=1 Tax=Paenibacillus gyeongsangnamensis TaxID=3388067 RepID=A0ABT4QF10_9BACL|nr:hypothetical protein [Paenibacillus filicis]MCZ8515463.1 hypothetical protein [Paenibacillus filicis]
MKSLKIRKKAKALGTLVLIKLVLSVLIIVGLAEISKRISPQIGGIISGLPLGTGLSIYFISFEQGVDFTIKGVPWGIAGLSASILFCVIYLLVSRMKESTNRILLIAKSSFISIASFFIFGYFIFLMKFNLFQAILIFTTVFFINLFIINKLIRTPEKTNKPTSTLLQILSRGVTVGIILLIITGVASIVGSKWAGILSSFPSTLFPLILVLHYEEGSKLFPYVIFGFSYSISTLLVFYLCYIYFVPLYGLNIGFLIIYGICVIYLYFFRKIQVTLRLTRRSQ